MASKFKIGDLVWAKMKSFPAWPGKVIAPKPDVKRPAAAEKKHKHLVFFFGSENYGWIGDESLWHYMPYKDKFTVTTRVPKGFKEAQEAMDDALKAAPEQSALKLSDLPSIDEELDKIFAADATENDTSKMKMDIAAVKAKATEKKVLGSVYVLQKKNKSPKTVTKSTPKVKSMKVAKKRESSDPLPVPSKKMKMTSIQTKMPSKLSKKKKLIEKSSPESNNTSHIMVAEYEDEMPPMSDADSFMVLPKLGDLVSARNIIPTPMKIGFLGLGIMGSGIVHNLLKSGHEVTVWNRTPSKCREFVKEGALKGNSPAEVVMQCDMTFSCVSDPAALKDLVFGNCGVLQGISQGKAYIDMSTVDIETIQDINEAVTARGGRFLETPIIGSRKPSNDGQLLLLSAGDRSLYDDCFSCFQAMSKRTFFLGEVGTATKMKLVMTCMMGTVLAGLSESLALAEKVGLDQEDVMQIMQLSPIACSYIRTKGNAMLTSHYNEPQCKLQVYQKDLRLAVNLSDTVDQSLIVGSSVNELFKKGKAKGYGEHDAAAVYRAAAL